MARGKFQTLTEQMFYILLCLQTECCGTDIMDQVSAMTEGRVAVGPGTLYHLLDEFVSADMIRLTRTEGRKRSYILTDEGKEVLKGEYRRILKQAADYRRLVQNAYEE